MKKLLLLLALLPALTANSQVTLDWVQYTGGISIAVDHFDNVYTVNYEYALGGDITLTKRDPAGALLWQSSYNQTSTTRWDRATYLSCDENGNVIVTGTVMSGYSNPVSANSIVMKFDSNGNLLWRNVYENDFDGSYTVKCLTDATNNIYVLGLGAGPNGLVTKVKKFNAAGNSLWSFFDASGIGAPLNFKFTPEGNILVIGRSISGSINGYAKIDMNGNSIWSYAGVNSLTIGDAAGDDSGNTYLVHGEYVTNGGSVVKKLSPAGILLWQQTYSIAAFRIEVGTDNNAVFCGFPNQGTPGAAFIKINTSGTTIWTNMDADGPLGLLLHARLLLDKFNNAYLAAGTLFEMAVCKVYSNGLSAWTATCPGGYANNMALGYVNGVFVVGGTTAHFSEEVICPVPSNLSTKNITAVSANLLWQPVSGALYYEVWYKKNVAANWKIKFVPAIKSHSIIKNLKCNTGYDWKIRTACDTTGTDVISAFSTIQTFTTASCRTANEDFQAAAPLLFPNPATATITINLEPYVGKVTLYVLDLNGRILLTQVEDGITEAEMDIHSLHSGLYVLRISDASGNISAIKWCKE
jgi:hypothetical protein